MPELPTIMEYHFTVVIHAPEGDPELLRLQIGEILVTNGLLVGINHAYFGKPVDAITQ